MSRHPTATWSLPTGVESRVIEVATDPATGSDGYFFSENVVALDVPTSTDTSWTYTYQLDPGTYYVHVGGSDTTCSTCPVREFSTHPHAGHTGASAAPASASPAGAAHTSDHQLRGG